MPSIYIDMRCTTCRPVDGLVQPLCIECNALASTTAINAARMALSGDGGYLIPLGTAIKTMREIGADMALTYKGTSEGGLAANIAAF